ncbi:putative disease resistance protein [Sesamum alatum]|uniref:Disease resistance protein n=1 Tax=Sesamum alatum TaxID=300844 RepID=A0AAE1Y7V1_9LAMI|nr:putative disease resistance protein [Sesamum alatum]
MAEAVGTVAVGALLRLMIYKFRGTFVSKKEVTEKINEIQQSVQLLQSQLSNNPQERQALNDRFGLQRDIKDIIYRFENVKENFSIAVASQGGSFSRFFKKLGCARLKDLREIYAEILEIENKIFLLGGVQEQMGRMIFVGERPSRANLSRETWFFQPEGFVGREEEIQVVRSYIINDPRCRVIGICGTGGSGKTALAQMLCSDAQVKNHFDVVAWVGMSEDFQPERVFRVLYQQLDPNRVSDMNAADLARRIYRIQQKRKCLIVLDDLWSSDAWRVLCVAFPSGETATGSKVLITSRFIQVVEAAEIVAGKRYIHKLRCLTQAEGCQLFMKRVFPDFEDRKIVEEVGNKMVNCCEALPLAILDFAGFMARKRTLEEWMEVHKNIQSFVNKSQQLGATLKSLALSYINLPHYLKQCFLYLGHSHEHSPIEAQKMYLLWLAEGLISVEDCGREEMLLNVAERYLEDLARRSMIEVHEEEVPTATRYDSCQLSQLMRRLCLMENQEQSFFKVVNFECGTEQVMGSSVSDRLSINLDKYEHKYCFQMEDAEKKKMRCLLISAKESQREVVWPHQLSGLVKFKYLRILEFMRISLQVTELILEGVEKLVHLRYLSFRDCTLPELPSSIGNLKLLYVLDLRVVNTMVIPDVLWKLKKLKHLYFPQSFKTRDASKLRLGGLTDLETVTNLKTNMCNTEDLFELHNLHYIGLNVPGSLEDIELIVKLMNTNSDVRLLRASLEVSEFDCYTEERLGALKQLLGCQSLIILCFGGHISRLPLHNEVSSNLVKIVLDGSELMEDPMPTLEKLPKLLVLVLGVDAFVGKTMACYAPGFIELRRLELLNLQYLEKWTVEEGAMIRLSTLTIVNCKKLKMLPKELLLSVLALQQVRVSGMCEEFKESIEIVKGDLPKMQHVPTITIED